jgi:heme/copper-type cytochrome/quinol oxidase subunit 1
MANDIYLALVTIHGTIMVFFVLTAVSGTFSNLLIPLQIGTRYGLGIHEHDFILVVFHLKCNMIGSLLLKSGLIRMDYLPSIECFAKLFQVLVWDDFMVGFDGYLHPL